MSREGAWLSVVVSAFGDAWRALDTMTRLIEQIDSVTTERLRTLARTVRYGTEGPSTKALPPQVLVTSDPSGKALKDVTGSFAAEGVALA